MTTDTSRVCVGVNTVVVIALLIRCIVDQNLSGKKRPRIYKLQVV